jgi:heat shock protein HslJ
MNARIAILAALAAIAVAACGSAAGATSVPSPLGDSSGLDGRTFLSTSIEGRTLVAGSRVRLAFDAGKVGASAGCNSMSGAYSIAGGHLKVAEMSTTEMGCDAALMAQDQWLAGFLADTAATLSGDTLKLTAGGVTLTLTDRVVADPDRQLAGTHWLLDSIVNGDVVSSVPVGVTASITFADGNVAISTGCNTAGGTAAIGNGTVKLGDITMTTMACAGDAWVVESAMVAALKGEVAWSIKASALTIGPAGHELVFRADSTAVPTA